MKKDNSCSELNHTDVCHRNIVIKVARNLLIWVVFPKFGLLKNCPLFTCVVSAVLAIVAIIGNTSIVAAVIKDPLKKLHTPFNYFLVNLAVSDLIIGVITMPVSTYLHYTEYMDSLEIVVVKTLHMSYFISATSSLLSLIALSLDRLIAITYATKYRKYMRFRRCLLVSAVIWIISLSIPFIYLKWNLFWLSHAFCSLRYNCWSRNNDNCTRPCYEVFKSTK